MLQQTFSTFGKKIFKCGIIRPKQPIRQNGYIQLLPDCVPGYDFFRQVFCADAQLDELYGLAFSFLYLHVFLIQTNPISTSLSQSTL